MSAAGRTHVVPGTWANEWYTPPKYIEAARKAMGGIDLDPASSDAAQEIVLATRYFTAEDDGLKQEWRGRVWLHPPFGRALVPQFIEKLICEFKAGRVEQAIVLTQNSTDTRWFHMGAKACDALCFTRGRIRFVNPAGDMCSQVQGQAFFYYGANVERFREFFRPLGFIRPRPARDSMAVVA